MRTHTLCALAATAALLALAACGGSNTATSNNDDGGMSAYDTALKAINDAGTDAAITQALEAAKANDKISASDRTKLETAATARRTVLETMAREMDQKKELMNALAEVDTSDLSDADKLAAAETAIEKLREAYDGADDVSDADKARYRTSLDNADKAVRQQKQKNALSAASGKLDMALAEFAGVTPTKEQLDAAMAALRELKTALTDAKDLTDDEKDRYQAQANRADADGGPIKTAQGHYHAHVVKNIEDTQIAAAMTAVGMVTDTSDESTVTDAQDKIDAAKAEIEGANIPGPEKAKLRSMIATHQGALDLVKARRAHAMKVRTIKDGPIKVAKDKVAMLKRDSSQEEWADAEAKLAAAKKAIDDEEGLPADKMEELREALKMQRDALDTAIAGRKAFANAMFAALGGHNENTASYRDALNNLARAADYKFPLSDSSKPTGLWLDPHDEGPGSLPKDETNESPIVFTEVKTRGQVGEWKVTDQTGAVDEDGSRDAGLKKFHDRARVYNNRTARTYPAATFFLPEGNAGRPSHVSDRPNFAGTYDVAKRSLTLADNAIDGGIASPEFQSSGTKDFRPTGAGKEVTVRGTYHGAPGTYRCTWSAAGDCNVSVGRGGVNVHRNWEFVHDKDAEVSFPNSDFAYFGWWVRENAGDRVPRMATAFIGVEGGGIDSSTDGDSNTVHGTATFEGDAVGQYAIIREEGGEFTAKARLEARFGTTDNVPQTGMSGTIDQFRLNGGSEDPGWTVTLHKGAWASGGRVDNSSETSWSINGTVVAGEKGSWGAYMYDTTVASSVGGDDGNSQPDLVLGTFYTEHGPTHRMVGAFGARNIAKQ